MAKQNEPTRHWNSSSAPLSIISRTTSQTGYRWPNALPTTNSLRQPRQPHSLPTWDITLSVPLNCLPPPIHRKISNPWKLPQSYMTSMNLFARRSCTHRQNNKRTLIGPEFPPLSTNLEMESGSMVGTSRPAIHQSSLIINAWDASRLQHSSESMQVASSFPPP